MANKIKHYKTIDNAFSRNLGENIYSAKYNIVQWGSTWLNSGYYPDRNKPCTLTYNEYRNNWEITTK